jgi:hypothetical protein
MLNLKTVQVDYTLAFVQGPAENNTFVKMPRMFDVPGYVFELKHNLGFVKHLETFLHT